MQWQLSIMDQELKQKVMALFEQQQFKEAAYYLQQSQQQYQADAEYWYIYAGVKGLSGDMASAEKFCRKSTELNPDFALAWFRLANALDVQGHHQDALEYFDKTLELQPDFAHGWNNKGLALMAMSLPAEAEQCYRKAIKRDQNTIEFTTNLGLSCLAQIKVDEAISYFEHVLHIAPQDVETAWSLANALLVLGQYKKGWHYYDCRWQRPGKAQRIYKQALWHGESIPGKTLFVYPEQGLGDFIQFIRFIPLVKESGARTLVQCPESLLPIIKSMPGIDQLVTSDANIQFDLQVPIANLPSLYIEQDSDIPLQSKYLTLDDSLVSNSVEWSSTFDTHKVKAGLIWSGNPKHSNDFNRSASLEALVPLIKNSDVQFYSLQKDRVDAAEQKLMADYHVIDLGAHISDFNDTALILNSLDIMFCVDTAVAHFAGAMGINTCVFLPYGPDWRWQLKRNDSVWYESVTLLRQESIGDWSSVVAQAQKELLGYMK